MIVDAGNECSIGTDVPGRTRGFVIDVVGSSTTATTTVGFTCTCTATITGAITSIDHDHVNVY